MLWTIGLCQLKQGPFGLRLDWIQLKKLFSIINKKER